LQFNERLTASNKLTPMLIAFLDGNTFNGCGSLV